MLSQFEVASLSKWSMSYDTAKHHEAGNEKDLCYEVITGEGKHCMFAPTAEGLHACIVQKEKADRVFGDSVPDKGTAYGKSMCHAAFGENVGVTVDENNGESDKEENEGPPPLRDDPDSNSDDDDSDDETADNDNVDNVATTANDSEAIETVKNSKQKCTKRHQLKAGIVRRFQHVAGYPSEENMSYSATTNGVKHSPITGRDESLAR